LLEKIAGLISSKQGFYALRNNGVSTCGAVKKGAALSWGKFQGSVKGGLFALRRLAAHGMVGTLLLVLREIGQPKGSSKYYLRKNTV
jgi:hypothetical protein